MTVQDAWLPYEEEQVCHVSYASMKEGIFALKGLEGAKWKWNKATPGNGTSRAFFVCNSHVDCAAGAGKQMRCVLHDGRFMIEHKGEHGEEPSMKQRLNSPLTWKQAADVSMMATTGAKAGAMHTAMTDAVAKQHEAAGEEPLAFKLPEGGIQGVRT